MSTEFPCCGGNDETPKEHCQDCPDKLIGNWHVPQFTRYTVRIPLHANYMRYNAENSIEVYAQNKKEAIREAKKHYRNELRSALKEIKVYERD
jgi:hypothetical protein